MKKLISLTHLTIIAGFFLVTASSTFAGWVNTNWIYRKAITIDHTKVGTDQSGFPVLINLASDAGLAAHARSDGFDLLFTSSDGTTVLPYEREEYTNTTGKLVAWVKIPTLSSTADTVLYLYYGNAAATDQQAASNVWDTNYKGVWHLDENPTGTAPQFLDSTAGTNKGTAGGTFVAGDQQAGIIYNGLHYGGAANVAIANQSNFGFQYNNPFSIEYWAKPGSTTTKQSPISKLQNSGSFPGYEIGHNTSGAAGNNSPGYLRVILVNSATGTTHQISVSTAAASHLNDGNWHHYVYTYSGSGTAAGVTIYEDGVALTTTSDADSLSSQSMLNTTALNLGSRANAGLYYNGLLDEVRVSATTRSAKWITAEYNNQSSPATFYSLGTEQAISTLVSVSSSLNPSTYGQSVTFTATVSSSGSTPTGTITFLDGVTTLGAGTLNGSGQTTLSLSSLSVGSHTITAQYGGDGNNPASSGTLAGGQIVNTAAPVVLFSDNFERTNYPGNIAPWVALQGASLATNANFQGTSDATNYSFAYLATIWTNYSLQAQVQFSVSNAYGGGLAGRLNPATGARYAAWIYPEQSPAGPALLRLIKFRDWTTWSATPMALVSLPTVGTNWHTLNLAFQGYKITVSFDGVQVTNVIDYGFDNRPAYSSGGVSADIYTSGSNSYIMSVSNAVATALAPVLLPLTVTASNDSRAYGLTNASLTGTIMGLQMGDNISATYSTAAVTNSPVGIYQIVPTLSDPDGKLGNFYFVTTNFGTLTVTQAVLTVAADAKGKTYGTTDPALTYQITSGALVGSDTFTGNLSRVAGENVGSYAINQNTLTAGNNYSLTYVGANLNIGAASIAITADAKTKTYGTTDPALTYQITSGALVGNDTISGNLSRMAGENVGSYAINQNTLTAGNNYSLAFVGANLSIGAASIAVTADAKTKTYGTTDPALTYQITTGALVGSDTFTGNLSRMAGENVGSYIINQNTLTAGGNYLLTYIGTNLNITPAAITVTADTNGKTYGASDPALTYQITGGSLVNGDSLTGDLTRVAGENAATYAIQQGTLAANANYFLNFVGADFIITPAGSAMAINSSMNPSDQSSNVTFTGSVTPVMPAGTIPTGNVQFYANGAPLGDLLPLSGGVASISTATLPIGSNAITAAYVSDGNFSASTNTLAQVVNIFAQAPSAVGITVNGDGTITVTFQGTPGSQYLVQAVSDLGQSASWENVSTNIAGSDGQWTFIEPVAAHAQRFYRAKP